jgi:selenide,water dikinase
MLTNATARPGDVLILTKPLGTGFVTTASKRGIVPPAVLDAAIRSMTQLNVIGRDAVRVCRDKVHALTDVTGYGLAGHAFEMAEGAGVTIELDSFSFPILEGSAPYATSASFSRANTSNRAYLEPHLALSESAHPERLEYAFDPQTSGGLLIAADPDAADTLLEELRRRGAEAAQVVGRVLPREGAIAIRIL